MTLPKTRAAAPGRRLRPAMVLTALAVVAVVVALLTPEAADNSGGQLSSYSVAPGGARLSFELAKRLGWSVQRRLTPLDSGVDPGTVHAVIAPSSDLGAKEIHRLLNDVRAGAGLIIAVDDQDAIIDSLGLRIGVEPRWFGDPLDPRCRNSPIEGAFVLPPSVRRLAWRRPAPGPTTLLAETDRRFGNLPIALGVHVGRGRVAVVGSADLFRNSAVETCQWGADLIVARAFEFVRPSMTARPTMLFDEYHHGFGTHPGSMTAVARYLARTSSGHVFLQALLAGLVLLLAYAPRPIVPRDPERIARRSPIEHADALGRAYEDVDATRTATAHLVWGLRRRVGRMVGVASGVSDDAFLDAVGRRHSELQASADVVSKALRGPIADREFVAVGDALIEIERHLTSSPVTRS
jgi:hypothetical protein